MEAFSAFSRADGCVRKFAGVKGSRQGVVYGVDCSRPSFPPPALTGSQTRECLLRDGRRSRARSGFCPRGSRAEVDPGAIQTKRVKKLIESPGAGKDAAVAAYDWKTVPQGAATLIWLGFLAPADEGSRLRTSRVGQRLRSVSLTIERDACGFDVSSAGKCPHRQCRHWNEYLSAKVSELIIHSWRDAWRHLACDVTVSF